MSAWCLEFETGLHDKQHQFCERHQVAWCWICEGDECPECRTRRLLGEPQDDDEDNEAIA